MLNITNTLSFETSPQEEEVSLKILPSITLRETFEKLGTSFEKVKLKSHVS